MKILLIGTGPMAVDYYNVLKDLFEDIIVVGRSIDSTTSFTNTTGYPATSGGIENYIKTNSIETITHAVIATGTESLLSNTKLLVDNNIPNILVEKPGALSIDELVSNTAYFNNKKSKIFIAYNRRFYSSVQESIKLIEEDGGLTSMNFEFTEWSHIITTLRKAKGVKENWFFANSSHVVDLAFFISGKPTNWSSYSSGKNDWHSPTIFSGAGITEKNVLFSYGSNWEAPGRWAIELLTSKRRIYLKPLEKIFIQKIGSVNLEEHTFDNQLDNKYKAGLFNQCKAFKYDNSSLLTINEHIENSQNIYSKIVK